MVVGTRPRDPLKYKVAPAKPVLGSVSKAIVRTWETEGRQIEAMRKAFRSEDEQAKPKVRDPINDQPNALFKAFVRMHKHGI